MERGRGGGYNRQGEHKTTYDGNQKVREARPVFLHSSYFRASAVAEHCYTGVSSAGSRLIGG